MNELTVRSVTLINLNGIVERESGCYRTIRVETTDGLQVEITLYADEPESLKIFI
jgi:hypothetical protein